MKTTMILQMFILWLMLSSTWWKVSLSDQPRKILVEDGVPYIPIPEDIESRPDEVDRLKGVVNKEHIIGVPDNVQDATFTTPRLSDEEERSPHMPEYLKCDACIGVAHQLKLSLAYAHRNIKFETELSSWDVIEALEDTCHNQRFLSYGLTEEEGGRHRIRGPGLEDQVKGGRISQMGGKWPLRMMEVCLELIGNFEDQEMDVYRAWRESDSRDLDTFLCKNREKKRLDICLRNIKQPKLERSDIEQMIQELEKEKTVQNNQAEDGKGKKKKAAKNEKKQNQDAEIKAKSEDIAVNMDKVASKTKQREDKSKNEGKMKTKSVEKPAKTDKATTSEKCGQDTDDVPIMMDDGGSKTVDGKVKETKKGKKEKNDGQEPKREGKAKEETNQGKEKTLNKSNEVKEVKKTDGNRNENNKSDINKKGKKDADKGQAPGKTNGNLHELVDDEVPVRMGVSKEENKNVEKSKTSEKNSKDGKDKEIENDSKKTEGKVKTKKENQKEKATDKNVGKEKGAKKENKINSQSAGENEKKSEKEKADATSKEKSREDRNKGKEKVKKIKEKSVQGSEFEDIPVDMSSEPPAKRLDKPTGTRSKDEL